MSPRSSNSCVMPIFLPRIPVTLIISSSSSCVALSARTVGKTRETKRCCSCSLTYRQLLGNGLNLYVHACGQIKLHQRVNRLLCRLENVDQTLVRPNLESLARLLIDVWRTQNAIFVLHRR